MRLEIPVAEFVLQKARGDDAVAGITQDGNPGIGPDIVMCWRVEEGSIGPRTRPCDEDLIRRKKVLTSPFFYRPGVVPAFVFDFLQPIVGTTVAEMDVPRAIGDKDDVPVFERIERVVQITEASEQIVRVIPGRRVHVFVEGLNIDACGEIPACPTSLVVDEQLVHGTSLDEIVVRRAVGADGVEGILSISDSRVLSG